MTTNDKIETRQIDDRTFAARRGAGMWRTFSCHDGQYHVSAGKAGTYMTPSFEGAAEYAAVFGTQKSRTLKGFLEESDA